MKTGKLVLIGLFLIANFLLVDFPGAKIVLALAIVVILFNYLYTRGVKREMTVRRFMDTEKVFMGLSEDTSLVTSNGFFLPMHALIVTDSADLNISIQQMHYFLFSIDPMGSELASYQLFGRKRGKYHVGPTRVKFSDFMGMNSFTLEYDTVKDIIVFPNIYIVANMPFKSLQPYGSIRNNLRIFEDPTMIVGLKEYQYGDEIKKINWKVSAKYDKLYINTYQPAISAGSVLILNLFENDYNFRNKEYYMEQAIEISASFIRHLFIFRQEIALAVNCRIDRIDTKVISEINKGDAHFTRLLTSLSLMEPAAQTPLQNLLDLSALNLKWGTCIYLVTPRLDEASLYKLLEFRRTGHTVTLINLGPEIQKDMSLWNIGFQSFYAEIEGNLINLLRI
ncbi:MAG: hypothetical protein A2014_01720 [Spirochaetes bacterium GWF1_49_6]|nr:MAG: hypothetical protein A2014_01720 [Spirochaetes bacterium GWF1_49_6]